MAQPRYTYRRSFFSGYFTTGVKWLLIVNTAVFILTGLLSPQYTSDIMLLALAPVAVVKHFAIWQLATYLFLHGGVWHLVFNMLTLWMFGTPLERDWGTRRFLKYYFIFGIGAGLCDVLLNAVIGNWHTSTIGASGAIYLAGARLGHPAVPQVLFHLRHRRRSLRCPAQRRHRQLAYQHHRRFGRDLWPAAGLRRLLSRPDRADELPVPHQGQVHGHDLRRN